MWNGTDWTVIGSQAAGVAAILWTGYKWLNSHFPKEVKFVEDKIPGGVKTVLEDGAKLFEHLLQSPWFAAKAKVGKLTAQHVIDHLNSTTAVSEAKSILINVEKLYSELAPNEKVKAEVMLRMVLSGLGINMTDTQIQGVFDEADKAIEALKNDARFKVVFGDSVQPQQSA